MLSVAPFKLYILTPVSVTLTNLPGHNYDSLKKQWHIFLFWVQVEQVLLCLCCVVVETERFWDCKLAERVHELNVRWDTRAVLFWHYLSARGKEECYDLKSSSTVGWLVAYVFPHLKVLSSSSSSSSSVCCIGLFVHVFIDWWLLIKRYSPLSRRLTALACDSTWVTSFS